MSGGIAYSAVKSRWSAFKRVKISPKDLGVGNNNSTNVTSTPVEAPEIGSLFVGTTAGYSRFKQLWKGYNNFFFGPIGVSYESVCLFSANPGHFAKSVLKMF